MKVGGDLLDLLLNIMHFLVNILMIVKSGIVPSQREEGKKHLVKYFATIDQSVEVLF